MTEPQSTPAQGSSQHSPERIAQFWSKVDKSAGPDGCWLWTRGRNSHGYGAFSVNSQNVGAHRVSWEIAHGPIPKGMEVCHNCPDGDNPLCVNPAHLWLGTNLQNVRDMIQKGRHAHGDTHPLHKNPEKAARGARNGNARLKEDQVRQILALHASGGNMVQIAAQFGVRPGTVHFIVTGATWKHIPRPNRE